MKTAVCALLGACLTFAIASPASASNRSAQAVVAKLVARWNSIKTYQCTITAHEVKGLAVQDRVYHYYFAKPSDTRADIVGGAGRGSVGVWRGGANVRGHQGGILRAITLNVSLHSPLATTLRGATFADSNIGAILQHIKSLPFRSLDARTNGNISLLIAHFTDPPARDGISKEVYYFGVDRLPLRYEQFEGTRLVKRVIYSDMKLNVHLSASLFNV